MIKEEAKLGIAMDMMTYKIAQQTIKIRENKDQNKTAELEKELDKLINEQKQVYANNYNVINKIIDYIGRSKND